MSDSLWPHELQHARLPCPSASPGACSNSCPLSQWCHPTISSSVVPFSSHLLSFPACFFSYESVLHIRWPKFGTSASASVLPMNIQDWFPLGLTSLISFLSKGLSRVSSNTTVQKHQFFGAQPSLWPNSHLYMTTGKTIASTKIYTQIYTKHRQTHNPPPRIRNEFNMENSYSLYVELRLPVDNLCLNRDLLIQEKIS